MPYSYVKQSYARQAFKNESRSKIYEFINTSCVRYFGNIHKLYRETEKKKTHRKPIESQRQLKKKKSSRIHFPVSIACMRKNRLHIRKA